MGCISSSPAVQIKCLVEMKKGKNKVSELTSYRNQTSDSNRDKNRRKFNKVEFIDQTQFIQPTQNVILSTEQFTVDDKSMLDQILSKNYIFHKLSLQERKELVDKFILYDSQFSKKCSSSLIKGNLDNSYLFKKNQIGTMFFVIKNGTVQIQLQTNEQNQIRYCKKILTRGQYFGQLALLYKTLRTASVKCLEKCTFLCLTSFSFRQALQNIVQRAIQSNKILIERIKLFQYLTPKQKNKLANNVVLLKFQKDQIIFHLGDQSMAFYIIVSGIISIEIKNKPSLQLRPGDYFGQSCFIQNSKRSGTAKCLQKAQLISINRQTIFKIFPQQKQQYYFFSILKWSLKRNLIFNQIPGVAIEKLLKQSDIVCFDNEKEILKSGQKIRKLYIPIEGTINSYDIGQIVNWQYLEEIQKDRRKLPVLTCSLTKNLQGHVCVIDISKVLNLLEKNSIQISKIDPNLRLAMQNSIMAKNQSFLHQFSKQQRQYHNSTIKLQHLTMVKKIGDGQFGAIYKVRYIMSNKFYALKSFKKSQIQSYRMKHFLKQQIQVMKNINFDRFIVEYEKFFQTDEYILILMELIDGKDFFDTILEIGWLNSDLVRFFFAMFVLAIEYLHQNDIIYRDIKPQNAVMQSSGYLKLIDLGTSRKLISSTGYRSFTIIGTPHYMAPQVIAGKGYSFEADIWSLGILLYQMACGKFPFGQKLQEPIQIYNEIIKPNLSIIYPKQLKDKSLKRLIERLLVKDPLIRQIQNFNDIKQSQFYQCFEWSKFEQKAMKAPFKPQIKHNVPEQINSKKKLSEQTLVNFLQRLRIKTKKQNPKVSFHNWDDF